jgi:hypothetical protein
MGATLMLVLGRENSLVRAEDALHAEARAILGTNALSELSLSSSGTGDMRFNDDLKRVDGDFAIGIPGVGCLLRTQGIEHPRTTSSFGRVNSS